MTRRQIPWLLGALLVLPGVGGCEQDHLNAAAIVDDEKITVTEIQGALERVREAQERFGVEGEDLPQAARNEVHRRVIVLIYAKAAADMGITVTEGEMAAQTAELRRRAGGEEMFERTQISYGKTMDVVADETRLTLIETKMAEKLSAEAGRELPRAEVVQLIGERLMATAKSMRIRINPRYGTFDPVEGSIKPYQYDFFRPQA